MKYNGYLIITNVFIKDLSNNGQNLFKNPYTGEFLAIFWTQLLDIYLAMKIQNNNINY